jgi:hypothetical protein
MAAFASNGHRRPFEVTPADARYWDLAAIHEIDAMQRFVWSGRASQDDFRVGRT